MDSKSKDRRTQWALSCDCGKKIVLARSVFAKKNGQQSCGCLRSEKAKERLPNLRRGRGNQVYAVGQKIGDLTILEKLPTRHKRFLQWLCLCSCGAQCIKTTHNFSDRCRLNCGDRQHIPGAWYPPAPEILPDEVWETVKKFLPLVNGDRHNFIDQKAQDWRMDRLIRSAWILHYRETELKEKFEPKKRTNYIRKCLRFSRHQYEAKNPRQPYTRETKIGSEMTNLTFPLYPIRETLGNDFLSTPIGKRLRFKRC